MEQRNWSRTAGRLMSRRAVIGTSGAAAIALLSRRVAGVEEAKKTDAGRSPARGRAEQSRGFMDRLLNASPEERSQIIAEQRAQQQRQAIEDLKGQLGVSDTDWAVIKPRIEKVYNLVHPAQMFGPNTGQSKTEIQARSDELRELLRDEKAATEQLKGKLAAYRSAKEKAGRELVAARQALRQVMTLRQEVQLVLNGLLD